MNNVDVNRMLDDCSAELSHVKLLIDNSGGSSSIAPYLTKYAVIRACGSIEQAYKSIVCDFCSRQSTKQVKRFIDQRVRESSANPTYSNICKLLKAFDEDWCDQFKIKVGNAPEKDVWMMALASLVDARNIFAHGGNPSASIGDITRYFAYSKAVIEAIDSSVV